MKMTPVKAWRWSNVKCSMNEVRMSSFYSDPDKDNHGKWWQPAKPANFVDKKYPQMFYLQLDMGYFAAEEPRTCMDNREEVARLILVGVGGITTTMEKLIL